jgi:predicted DNA-binding WGR domain protein
MLRKEYSMDASDAMGHTPSSGGGTAVRLFHCTTDQAHKFWSIQIRDTVHTVRFGRIGCTGQTCLKTFPTPQQANKAAERLIREKRAKGYVEVSPEDAAEVRPRGCARRRSVWQQLCLPFELPVESNKHPAVVGQYRAAGE